MTPAAVTPAARSRPRPAASRAAKAAAHPRPVRARVAPAGPRRVSGPKRPVRAQPARDSGVSLSSRAADFVRRDPQAFSKSTNQRRFACSEIAHQQQD